MADRVTGLGEIAMQIARFDLHSADGASFEAGWRIAREHSPFKRVSGRGVQPSNPSVARPLSGYAGQDLTLMEAADTIWAKALVKPELFVAQPNDWSCGAAVLCMAYRTLANREMPYAVAVRRTGANSEIGTENHLLENAFHNCARSFEVRAGMTGIEPHEAGLSTQARQARREGELSNIRSLLEREYLVIVNFRHPRDGCGHFGIVRGLNSRAIELADPWSGPRCVLQREKFDFRSGFTEPVIRGWYLAVKLGVESRQWPRPG